MISHIELEAYKQLVSYLNASISLQQLREWFDRATWNIQIWDSALLSQIELGFAEYTSGGRTEGEFRSLLENAIAGANIQLELLEAATVVTSSVNRTQQITLLVREGVPVPFAGKLHVSQCV